MQRQKTKNRRYKKKKHQVVILKPKKKKFCLKYLHMDNDEQNLKKRHVMEKRYVQNRRK